MKRESREKKIKKAAETLMSTAPEIIEILQQNIFSKKEHHPNFVGKYDEEAVLVLSDMHCGTVNEIYNANLGRKEETYNEKIRQQEQLYLRDSIFQICDIFSNSYNLKKLHIFMLGDMITNDRIFDGQMFEIDRPYGRQIWDVVRDLTYFINEMKKKFETIELIGIVGNHGRSSDTYEEPVENNFEYHLYRILAEIFKNDKRVSIVVPNTRFYSTQILGHTYYMNHGDSIRGFSRSCIDRAAREVLAAMIPDLPQGFDVYTIGHFHGSEKMQLNEKSTLLINGSWIPRDQYGYKMFRRFSRPSQWLFGVGRKRAMTWSFDLDLQGVDK